MARPQKRSIDYFPLDCSMNDSVKFIEAKHGITGFGTLIKLWSKIYSGEGYYCHWDEKTKYLFCKEIGVDIATLDDILQSCLDENLFDRQKLQAFSILTSQGIQLRYFKIVKEAKRKDIEMNPDYYLLKINSGVNSVNSGRNPENSRNTPEETPLTHGESTQSKVKKSKVKKSKGKEGREKPPGNSSDSDFSKETTAEKEKICAKKEKRIYHDCKMVFLHEAKGYYWEARDDRELKQLLTKMDGTVENVLSEQQLRENFILLLQRLPKYWRTKKFTIHHINQNFNEIINEIQTHPDNGAKRGVGSMGKFGRHNADELASRAFTFGR